ncbi:transglycosylase SLT domain-containing protein [Vulgatibacter incomptus]|uniref:Soluble lytic murein transglycosylase n=1 Tax=Vulgatibacter incomptus TaxID=1391653 RepID=A0A0K1PD01_9BACT|nr:transglycosylase SLT domain-containing protein [Vulgatibacter incomptus]AKU91276.1 Soluble lytic murein transglycosylase precursor [Vulgatibacter incomptus]
MTTSARRLLLLLAPLTLAISAHASAAGETPAIQDGDRFGEARLAPYFADGKLRTARQRFETEKYAEAYRVFTEADDGSVQVAWLRALSALEIGKEKEAAAILQSLLPRYPALAPRIAWHLGLARERMDRMADAAKAYAEVPEGSVLADDARLAQARTLRQSGNARGALAPLAALRERAAPAWGVDYGASALFLAAELHAQLGEKKQAREAWLRLWSEHPLAPQAEDARQRAEAISRDPPTLRHQVRRAQGFLDVERNREGTEQIEKLLPSLKLPDALACEARFALGRGYRKLRQHTQAIATLEPVVGQCKEPALRVKALYILGYSASIVAPARAVEVYELLAKDYPGHSFADDALVYAAELRLRAGDRAGARAELVRMVEEYPDGDFRPDGLFRLFWIDRDAGEAAKGLEFLQRIERDYASAPDPIDLERSLYWQARTFADLGRKVEAVVTYERLLRSHPAGYYAMLARGRLGALAPRLAAEIEAQLPEVPAFLPPIELSVGALRDEPRFASAVELLRLGFPKAATDELLAIDRKALRTKGSLEPVLLVAWLLDRAEARRPAHQIARAELKALVRGRPEGNDAIHFRIAFPMAYRDLIEKHAKQFKVPPDLMQALMREESSLDPNVVSWAGAIGLTQLMPSTAQAVATKLKLGKVPPASLRDPELNVTLGTAYMGSLLERWGGNPALAAASYNAGPGAVARWLADRGDRQLDEFVEEIPIEQTRHYVKRVLGSFNAYRLVYGKGDARFLAMAPAKAKGK